jgi:surfactin synthase thioesterase subunit
MAKRTQLFAREVAGGIPAAAVHHWPDDALQDLWLVVLSSPGRAERWTWDMLAACA